MQQTWLVDLFSAYKSWIAIFLIALHLSTPPTLQPKNNHCCQLIQSVSASHISCVACNHPDRSPASALEICFAFSKQRLFAYKQTINQISTQNWAAFFSCWCFCCCCCYCASSIRCYVWLQLVQLCIEVGSPPMGIEHNLAVQEASDLGRSDCGRLHRMKFKSVCLSPTNDHFPCAIDVIAAMQMGDGSTAGGQEKKYRERLP